MCNTVSYIAPGPWSPGPVDGCGVQLDMYLRGAGAANRHICCAQAGDQPSHSLLRAVAALPAGHAEKPRAARPRLRALRRHAEADGGGSLWALPRVVCDLRRGVLSGIQKAQ